MNESDSINFALNPIIPIGYLLFISIIFFYIIFFATINKLNGSFFRIGIFLLYCILFLNPTYSIEKRVAENSIITFIIDKTDSQKITERVKETENIYNSILQKLSNFEGFDILEIIIENNQISSRKGSIQSILENNLKYKIEKVSTNDSTLLIQEMYNKINQYPIKKISSTFILTDGQIHDNLNQEFEKLNIPIYFIVPEQKSLNDRQLTILNYPEFGYLDEQVLIKVSAKDMNSENSEMNLNINYENFLNKKIKIKNNDVRTIKINLKKQGENYILFNLEKKVDEISKINNSKLIKINGVRRKLRVLLVSGEPYMGTRVWRNFLKSDTSVELVHMTVLRSPEKNDNTPIEDLALIPFPLKELFEEKLDNFQLIIFDNFKGKNVLTPLYYQNLIKFVEDGGAILEITGPSYNSKSSLFRTEIGRILPGAPTGKVLRQKYKPKLTESGKIHPITKSIFQNYSDYGPWYEMNKVQIDDPETSILMTGIEKNPLLSIKKIEDGRLAQIYSHQIWLWKKVNEKPGPYGNLIKNVAHWLMKEPLLEGDKLKVSQNKGDIIIEKKFFSEPNSSDLKINLIEPDGNRETIELVENKDKIYNYKVNFKKKGYYLVTDGVQTKVIENDNYQRPEFEDLSVSKDLIKKVEISNFFSKVLSYEEIKKLKFFDVENIDKSFESRRGLFLTKNNKFFIQEITKKELFNNYLILIIMMIFIVLCWRKESR